MLPYVFPLFSILLSFCFISFLELLILETSVHFTSVQSLSRVWLFMTPWIAARQHARPPCWRRQWHPTPVLFCLENPMDGGAWWAAVHGVTKSPARLSHFTLTFHFHALEKEMATHSSVLTWRIPGTGEPGGLPFMGSHRVGHDWSDLAAAAADEEWASLGNCSLQD